MLHDRTDIRARCRLIAALISILLPSASYAQDPRVGLRGGWHDAQAAISNLELISHTPRPAGFFTAGDPGDFGTANSDMAFRGNHVFVGNFNGWQVFDITNLEQPTLVKSLVCPGGQGDLSIHGNLLFMSVEETRGRIDCGAQGVADTVSAERFRGVRIFDISNITNPRQVAAVQTCRGSHTHTLVVDPNDKVNVYVYVGGTAGVRSANELSGCIGAAPEQNPNTALFRIDVIRVPRAAPQRAAIVSTPRVFANAATGAIAGLWRGGAHGEGTQTTAETDQCHDLTVYPEIGLAAGACSGNGILLDISDVVNPKRIDEVQDQVQTKFVWPAHFSVARAYVDQLERGGGLNAARIAALRSQLDGAERMSGSPQRTTLTRIAGAVEADAQGSTDALRVRALAEAVRKLAAVR